MAAAEALEVISKANAKPAPGLPERREKPRVNARDGTRVLVIDDSPTIVALLKRMLEQSGYTALEAVDAETGVALALAEDPDLIFLDIVLPGMNGFEALRRLRREPLTKTTPIIMISGNELATEQFYAQRIGADDFMKKPFSRSEVFARIEKLLDEEKVIRKHVPVSSAGATANAVAATTIAAAQVVMPAATAATATPFVAAPIVAAAVAAAPAAAVPVAAIAQPVAAPAPVVTAAPAAVVAHSVVAAPAAPAAAVIAPILAAIPEIAAPAEPVPAATIVMPGAAPSTTTVAVIAAPAATPVKPAIAAIAAAVTPLVAVINVVPPAAPAAAPAQQPTTH